jgi:dienelactone hydrolase
VDNQTDLNRYLGNLFDEDRRTHTCRAKTPDQVRAWQNAARPRLRALLGLDRIADECAAHRVQAQLRDPEDLGEYTRQQGLLHTEPGVAISFWFLRPKANGPFPVALLPHGHEHNGMNTYVGIPNRPGDETRIVDEHRDVAFQAVRRGMLALAPTTRGFFPAAVPDSTNRHSGQHCRCQAMHCLLAGRTAVGERVWDMMRFLDWIAARPDADPERILVMGNSGGGMVTLYTAACDERVRVAVPSCSFCTIAGVDGALHHCDCNAIPGLLRFGEMSDVAGLIAPRRLLAVNGSTDPLFPLSEVDRAAEGVRRIYTAAGCPDHFEHRYGEGGHRFYSDIMWPFVESALGLTPRS